MGAVIDTDSGAAWYSGPVTNERFVSPACGELRECRRYRPGAIPIARRTPFGRPVVPDV